ncbi:hypothetical protein J1N35_014352 [Gossypium stocksii]|uniref:Uncharacterized protein n=1 Tax=Gossypium stocksii TaxID=47602 RepID=A0A9D4A9M8_9ROSI|nr:hypothetical protein J1N35_014352 [Gossypium stocksii]
MVEVNVEVLIDGRYAIMDQAIGTFNIPSYSKVGTVVDARELSVGKQLLRCSKGDALFGVTMIIVITQPINNYNHCRTDLSLTSTMLGHPLFT